MIAILTDKPSVGKRNRKNHRRNQSKKTNMWKETATWLRGLSANMLSLAMPKDDQLRIGT